RIVLLQEGDYWPAQCLEYDIAAQAKTLTDLREELERVVVVHIVLSIELGGEPFAVLEPEPLKFRDMFEKSGVRIEADNIPSRCPDIESLSVRTKLRVAGGIYVN